jgi:hypothetical protein
MTIPAAWFHISAQLHMDGGERRRKLSSVF